MSSAPPREKIYLPVLPAVNVHISAISAEVSLELTWLSSSAEGSTYSMVNSVPSPSALIQNQ